MAVEPMGVGRGISQSYDMTRHWQFVESSNRRRATQNRIANRSSSAGEIGVPWCARFSASTNLISAV